MVDRYDDDILDWSEHQVALLRAVADHRPGNETPDWPNIIEEIESVGRSELRAIESLLTMALLHDLKCQAWPDSRDVPHWRAEARLFRRQARRKLTRSMVARLNPAELFNDALAGLPEALDGIPAGKLSLVPPASLDAALLDRPAAEEGLVGSEVPRREPSGTAQ